MARSITHIPAQNRTEVRKKTQKVTKLRMAAYCRVSTDQEDQLHSFAAQVDYYTRYIEEHVQYELAGIFADEGISGTNTKKRERFNAMIEACRKGEVDIVITKSISRFARNTQDCLRYVRELRNLGIPILFEKENINTMDSGGELLLTILSSLAQDESRNISENCTWGIRNKFRNGEMILNTNKFLGYDKDENGKLVINEKQAEVVRRIYREFLGGRNPQEIAAGLEKDGIESGTGSTKWYASGIIRILSNEKHKGDALLQKTFTADFMTKRQVRNNGEVAQVYITDDHEAIIDRDTWAAVQEELERRAEFVTRHHLNKYSYGAEKNPFTCHVFCGSCGKVYNRHAWTCRGVVKWQCMDHRINGRLICKNEFADEQDLKRGFVKAYNQLIASKRRLKGWERLADTGTPLQRMRARQMIELAAQEPLKNAVDDLIKLVVEEVTVHSAREYTFTFMEGSQIKVCV